MVVQWLGTLYISCFNPQMKMVALELILQISKKMPFDFCLNQALPWVMQAFRKGEAADNMGNEYGH